MDKVTLTEKEIKDIADRINKQLSTAEGMASFNAVMQTVDQTIERLANERAVDLELLRVPMSL